MPRRQHVKRGDGVDDVASDAPDEDSGGAAARCRFVDVHRNLSVRPGPGILGFGLMMDVVEPELVKVGCLEGTGLRVAEVDQRVAPVDMKVIITS